MYYGNDASIGDMVGKTFVTVKQTDHDGDELVFVADTGERYTFYHSQDCCESVWIEDISGDLCDLVGTPLLVAEERDSSGEPPLYDGEESYTWTFYTFRTIKGTVDVRWYGSSNGYYSESVYLRKE